MADRFSRFPRNAAAIVLVILAGCSDPYQTQSPKVSDPETGSAMTGLISLCYGTWMNTPEDIKAAAAENCNGTLVFVEQDVMFNDCPLIQHARATYQCRPLEVQGVVERGPVDGAEE